MQVLHLSAATLAALARGDTAAAADGAPVPLTDFVLTDPRCLSTWRLRAEQVRTTPADAPWVTGLLWDERDGVVGQGGFHGAPDANGVVEVGYAVDPALRRRGHGRAALRAMVERARREPDIRLVRACIAPDNAASLAVVAPLGFTRVGEAWDEEDGLELVLELAVAPA